ncbi:SusD/RagB family nutrient-binding outer membrane lipoprotein [Pontibacter russatus]|uniref:SusD/RagB family nutrient-binding outer membrane lipoprotein n=1 Tax=Pontibacter russatus TaxID=2694929 RepID=UPI00137A151F|nr:SusD/RagB family nutrient-binding outer membrane lipoprotein [Pontibacter russatus]
MKKIIRTIGIALSLLITSTACDKDEFLDVNTDPNNPASAPIELVFPAAVISTAGTVGGQYAILGGIWAQYYTQNNGSNQYKEIDQYNITPSTSAFSNRYTELYSGALNDYDYVIEQAREAENWNAYLMATAMQAYTFQVLTDLYDDIAFDEALRGDEGIANPMFRSGEAVYDSLIVRINDALAKEITAQAVPSLAQADIVFGGEMTDWVRFANTLKLKIYLRQIYARPDVAEAGLRSLYEGGAEFLAEPAAVDIFEDRTSARNPLYEMDQSTALNTNQNLKASETLFNYLVDDEGFRDSVRLKALYRPAAKGGYKPMEQGTFDLPTTSLDPLTTSRALIEPTAPVYFISEAESYFLQAEAALRGFGSASAEELYNQGVEEAYDQLGLERPEGAYEFPVGGSFEEKLEAIIVQKWVALAGTYQGLEAYFEILRTGYPDFLNYPAGGVTGGVFPTRLPIPNIVTQRNPNAPQKAEPITSPVWWDVN